MTTFQRTEVLRQLTHKDNMWEWTEVHEKALKRLKDKITNGPLLKYYDQKQRSSHYNVMLQKQDWVLP